MNSMLHECMKIINSKDNNDKINNHSDDGEDRNRHHHHNNKNVCIKVLFLRRTKQFFINKNSQSIKLRKPVN